MGWELKLCSSQPFPDLELHRRVWVGRRIPALPIPMAGNFHWPRELSLAQGARILFALGDGKGEELPAAAPVLVFGTGRSPVLRFWE